MLRFELKLLPLEDAANEADAQIISSSNAAAQNGYRHLKKILAKKRCRKHPSAANKLKIFAVKGGDPTAELSSWCCPEFLKLIK